MLWTRTWKQNINTCKIIKRKIESFKKNKKSKPRLSEKKKAYQIEGGDGVSLRLRRNLDTSFLTANMAWDPLIIYKWKGEDLEESRSRWNSLFFFSNMYFHVIVPVCCSFYNLVREFAENSPSFFNKHFHIKGSQIFVVIII